MSDDLFAAFKEALPGWARELLEPRAVADAHLALAAGHDPAELAEHATFHVRGLYNADEVFRSRLHRAAHPDETI
jgi:hypothetical protein